MAAYTVTISQVGSDVVALGQGSLNFYDLNFIGFQNPNQPGVSSPSAYLEIGDTDVFGNTGYADYYQFISGPGGFGSGVSGFATPDTTSGIVTGVDGIDNILIIPGGSYGEDLGVSTATWNGTTLAALGLVPGQYTYTWGSQNADSYTIDVVSSVPLPASAPMFGTALLGCAVVGYAAKRRKAAAA